MQLLMYRPSTSALWADALFASMLQRSDEPCAGQVPVGAIIAVFAGGFAVELVVGRPPGGGYLRG